MAVLLGLYGAEPGFKLMPSHLPEKCHTSELYLWPLWVGLFFVVILDNAHGLLLALCSGVTPGKAWGTT